MNSRVEKPTQYQIHLYHTVYNPELWFMENPNTGNLKNREYMKDLPCYVVDYCMYSDWGYRKRTRIWTNKQGWTPLKCDGSGSCGNMIGSLGNTERLKHKEDISGLKKRTTLDERYRIPEDLIFSLFLD